MTTTQHDRTRTLTIGYPIPLEVAGPLMAALGTMWPESKVEPGEFGVRIILPNKAAKRVSKKALRDLLPEVIDPDGDPEAVIESWVNGTITVSQDAFDEAQQRLATWALVFLRAMHAPNFVEQEVVAEEPDGTPRRFHITVAWSSGQAPSARLKQAEAEIRRLKALLEEQA